MQIGDLVKYEKDTRISMIAGNNFQDGKAHGDGSYYFSGYNHIWGWATWKRVWNYYDKNISFWPEWSKSKDWKEKFPDLLERIFWKRNFDSVYRNNIDTWDYQWVYTVLINGGLSILPNKNLVSNIGFGAGATHTTDLDSQLSKIPRNEIEFPLTHPTFLIKDARADYLTSSRFFKSEKLWRKFLNRLKAAVK